MSVVYHVYADVWRGQKKAADHMEIELQIVVRHSKSSLKNSNFALKRWAISLAPIYINIYLFAVSREKERVCVRAHMWESKKNL